MLAMGRPAQLLLLVVVLALPLLAAADEPQLLLPQSEPCSSADYTFVRDSAAAPVPVDRSLVGATLEDTSFSLYGGGLYSQLIYGEGFEEPRLEGAPGSARGAPAPRYLTWASGVHSPCHTLIPGKSKAAADQPFTGKQAVRLSASAGGTTAAAAACMISNMGGGGDRWGIALHSGREYQGYLFSRNTGTIRIGLCPPTQSDSGLLAPSACYATTLLPPPSQPSGGGWSQRNFTLTPNASNPRGSFVIWLEAGTVDLDAVFLEDSGNLFPGAQHVRKDLAEATLLNGSFQFLRFGGDMAGRSSYKWRTMRGPAWLRPPQTPGSWSPFSSNGFGMFEFLQFREAAGITRAILGTSSGLPNRKLGKCANPADNTTEMADLAEYLFAPPNRQASGGSALAALRERDGHPAPYNDAGLVIEIGNECHCDESYFPSLNETIAAVTSRVRSTAPHVGLLTFSSMAGVILERDCTASENAALAELVTYWHARNVQILSDQHIPSQSFGGVLQTIWNMTTMVEDMRTVKGAPRFKFFVGEENCATDKTVPNNPLCHGVGRALQHALYGNALHRMGNETCLGAASATLYGASGRQWEWPQAGIEFTPTAVLVQPPFHAKRMVGDSYRSRVLPTTPSRFNSSGCMCNGASRSVNGGSCLAADCEVVDLLLLADHAENEAASDAAAATATSGGLVVRVVSSVNRSIEVALNLSQSQQQQQASAAVPLTRRPSSVDASWSCESLACGVNASASNTLEAPASCVPRLLAAGAARVVEQSTLRLTLPPYSFTVCTQHAA